MWISVHVVITARVLNGLIYNKVKCLQVLPSLGIRFINAVSSLKQMILNQRLTFQTLVQQAKRLLKVLVSYKLTSSNLVYTADPTHCR